MKKSVLLIVLGVGFAFISCEKQDIHPRTNCNQDDVPRWEQSSSVVAPPAPVTNTSGSNGPDTGGITDPNDDEDGNGRKKV